jgi:hypothetical protein
MSVSDVVRVIVAVRAMMTGSLQRSSHVVQGRVGQGMAEVHPGHAARLTSKLWGMADIVALEHDPRICNHRSGESCDQTKS